MVDQYRDDCRPHSKIKMMAPQDRLVLEHLEKAGSITQAEANTVLKVRSVSSNVSRLRNAGFQIYKAHKTDSQGQRYVRYFLV